MRKHHQQQQHLTWIKLEWVWDISYYTIRTPNKQQQICLKSWWIKHFKFMATRLKYSKIRQVPKSFTILLIFQYLIYFVYLYLPEHDISLLIPSACRNGSDEPVQMHNEQQKVRWACENAQSHQSLPCSHTQHMEVIHVLKMIFPTSIRQQGKFSKISEDSVFFWPSDHFSM